MGWQHQVFWYCKSVLEEETAPSAVNLIFANCSTKMEGHKDQPASLFKRNHQVLIIKYLFTSNTEEICKPFIQQSNKNVCPNARKLLEYISDISRGVYPFTFDSFCNTRNQM